MKVTIKKEAMEAEFYQGIAYPCELEAHLITGLRMEHLLWVRGEDCIALGGREWTEGEAGGIYKHLLYAIHIEDVEDHEQVMAEIGLVYAPRETGTMEA